MGHFYAVEDGVERGMRRFLSYVPSILVSARDMSGL